MNFEFDQGFTPAPLVSEAQLRFIADLREAWTAAANELAVITGTPAPEPVWKDPATNAEASAMIERGIGARDAKRAELRAARLATRAPIVPEGFFTGVTSAPAPVVPAGRYAITDGEVKCYSVEYGKASSRWAEFCFLKRISSDDEFPVKNPAEKARILAAIGANTEASARLAAVTLRQCRRCSRRLSDTKNPHFAAGASVPSAATSSPSPPS